MTKNLFGLENTTSYFNDVRNISPEKYGTFDIALIAGILYHLDDPYFLLRKLSMVAENMVISTHYADETHRLRRRRFEVFRPRAVSIRGRYSEKDP